MNSSKWKARIEKNIPDHKSYRPRIFQTDSEEDMQALEELLDRKDDLIVYDRYRQQVNELMKLSHPTRQLSDEEQEELFRGYLDGRAAEEHGNWVYYPWSRSLVHLLVEKDFIAVRTNRNKYKITDEEREILSRKKIGIIGLSVGQSAALTIAMERLCGELRIADFDTLDLSNLNRLRSNVYSLGQEKTIMAAREIAELDPYLRVNCFFDGVTAENIDSFLEEGGKLDLVADECDSMPIKFQIRFAAREKGIPVVMDTSDRGLLDIERFDKEPKRAIFHGRIDEENIDYSNMMMILDAILDLSQISDRGKLSLSEVGKTITSWPQLASSVMLGGATVATAARKILLGEDVPSGRHYFDVGNELTKSKN